MNFLRYTFTGKFLQHAATFFGACIVAALPAYILNEIRFVYIIFGTYTTIFLGSVALRFFMWRSYLRDRATSLRKWANDKTRWN